MCYPFGLFLLYDEADTIMVWGGTGGLSPMAHLVHGCEDLERIWIPYPMKSLEISPCTALEQNNE